MTVEEITRGLEVRERSGPLPAALTGVHYDSRRIQPGGAFVAIRGEQADGNDFVAQAIGHGAAMIVSELPAPEATFPWLRVANARAALAQMSANWFHHPGGAMRLVGITGTNGKTTTAWLVEAMLRQAGETCGLLGTIENHIAGQVVPAPHTTPESRDLQDLLAQMRTAGCTATVMEVSSHALAMDRVYACPFEVAVFTNLTQDHLDYHGTMAAYACAKRRLFEGRGAPPPPAAVVNADDPASPDMLAGYHGRVIGYGFADSADLRATALDHRPDGLVFTLLGPGAGRRQVCSPLLGRANVYNLLACFGVGMALGLDLDTVAAQAADWPRVRGRFEPVYAGQPFTVLVDYAHTPDALANVLALARELTRGRVRVVFGCGGDRDRGKRPLMGQVARTGADWVALTSDNPRSEDPETILDDIAQGIPHPDLRQPDRRLAIRTALAAAVPGDTVVIAGKGHENYQIIGALRLHLDDAEEARTALADLGWRA